MTASNTAGYSSCALLLKPNACSYDRKYAHMQTSCRLKGVMKGET